MTLARKVSDYLEGTMSNESVLAEVSDSRHDRLSVVKAFCVIDREIRNHLTDAAGDATSTHALREKAALLISDTLETVTQDKPVALAIKMQGQMLRRYFSGPYPVYRDIASRNPKLSRHSLVIEGQDLALA